MFGSWKKSSIAPCEETKYEWLWAFIVMESGFLLPVLSCQEDNDLFSCLPLTLSVHTYSFQLVQRGQLCVIPFGLTSMTSSRRHIHITFFYQDQWYLCIFAAVLRNWTNDVYLIGNGMPFSLLKQFDWVENLLLTSYSKELFHCLRYITDLSQRFYRNYSLAFWGLFMVNLFLFW